MLNLIVLRWLLKDWKYFWNKCLICHPELFAVPSFHFWYPWYQKAKIALRMSLRNKKKKKINYHLKGLHKTTCYKTKSNFSQFSFSHWLLYDCFSFFHINALVNFEKLIFFRRPTMVVDIERPPNPHPPFSKSLHPPLFSMTCFVVR